MVVSGTWAAARKPSVDFNLPDLSGKAVKLSDYRGKLVLLNFWASWCPPCREEMPSLQKLHEKLKEKKFALLAVSIDRGGNPPLKSFIDRGGYTFQVLLDPEGRVASRYQVISIPTTFVIDRQGKIVERILGGRDWIKEFKRFETLLGGDKNG
jgi:peroxiredoxin